MSCGGPSRTLCASCRASLRPIAPPFCARCGAPTAWPVERCRECSGRRLAFASARAAVEYRAPVPAYLRAWKERGLRPLAELAADLVVSSLERPAADVITYVAPDPVRQLKRAGHPAEALARALGERWELPAAALLVRRRAVARQASLPLERRGPNVRGAFGADGATGSIALVDDVYTTGATANAAASALRAAGAARVEVVTFARATRL